MKEQPGSETYALYANSSGPPRGPIGEVYDRRLQATRSATTQLPLNTWTHLATTYDGSVAARSTSTASRSPRLPDRQARSRLDRPAPHRRQHHLGRVLQRRDRRGADLQPRPERRRDPAGHDACRSRTRTRAADRARERWRRRARLSSAQLSAGARRPTTSASCATTSTARRRPASRLERRQPDRAADRHELHRHRPDAPAPTTTGSGRGRGRQPERRLERGERGRRRHDAAVCPGHAERERGDRQGDPLVGRGDRQRRRGRATTSTARPRAGFTPSAANRIAQPTGTGYVDTTGARHLLLQGHSRGRGRQPRPGLERGERGRARPTRPRRARPPT